MPYREFDIIVYGATGFTGKLICKHLANKGGGAKWAAAGRSEEKLRAVLKDLNREQQPIVVAEATDAEQIGQLVQRTQCVIAAAGPFAKYGRELVKACAENGVHYLDLTGEPWFVNDVIQRHAKAALQHRAILINCSGFDSVPGDAGVYLACKALGSGKAGKTASVYFVKDTPSGGTVQTALDMRTQPANVMKEVLKNPYCLSPKRGKQQKNVVPWARRIGGHWGGLWGMAMVNQLVVQRTWGILETEPKSAKKEPFTYGPDFEYFEAMHVPGGPVGAFFLTLFLTIGMALMALKPISALLAKTGMAQSGSGPSRAMLEHGWYRVVTEAKAADGSRRAIVDQRGRGSPGYKLTSIMIAEAALALVKDHDRLPLTARAGGPLTPMTACGEVLIERLKKTGLFTFEVRVEEDEKTK